MKTRSFAILVLILLLALSSLLLSSAVTAQDSGPATSGEPGPEVTEEPQQASVEEPGPQVPPETGTTSYPEEGVRLEDTAVQGEPAQAEGAEGAPQAGGVLNTGGFVFVLRASSTGSYIDRYSADAGTGDLTYLGSTNTGQNGGSWWTAHLLAYDAANYRLYALHDNSNTITAYSVDRASGWLTPLPFSPISLGAGSWDSVVVHPGGSPVIVANSNTNSLASYRIGITATAGTPAVTASLTNTYSLGTATPYSVAFSKDGQYVYAGGNSGNTMAGFAVNPTTGALTALGGSPFEVGNVPLGYDFDSSGRLFFSLRSEATSKIATTSAGIPTIVHTLTPNGLSTAVDGLLHPTENYYLVADRGGNRVGVFRVSGSGAASTLGAVSGSPFATGGTFTQALAANESGSAVYAVNSNSRSITRFSFNFATGALTSPTLTLTPGSSGTLQGIAYANYAPPSATGGFLYALRTTSTNDNYIDTYHAAAGGALTLLSSRSTGGKSAVMTVPHRLVYDRINARLFALDSGGSPTVRVFSVNPVTGDLSSLYTQGLPGGQNWFGMAIHPSGSLLAVYGDTSIAIYRMTPTGPSAAAGSPFAAGSYMMFNLAFSQDGGYLYAGGRFGTTLLAYSVNPSTGVLTPLAGSPFNVNISPDALVTDSLGRLFFSQVNTTAAATTTAGAPTVVTSLSPNGVNLAAFGLIHLAGFYLVADREADKVAVFRVEGQGSSTALSVVAGSPVATGGDFPHFLALTETGDTLYAGNQLSGNISRFTFNVFTGGLALVDITQPVSAGASVIGLAYAPQVDPGSFVYTLSNADGGQNQIYGYMLDYITGSLSLLPGFPVATGGTGDSYFFHRNLAYDRLNHRLYAANGGSKSLSAFSVNTDTGALTHLPFSPYPVGGSSSLTTVAVHPSGSPVLVGNFSSELKSFNVTDTTISLAVGGAITLPGSTALSAVVFTQDGSHAYTGEGGLNAINVNAATGAVSLIPGSPFLLSKGPIPGAFDASGRLFTSLFQTRGLHVSTLDGAGVPLTASNFDLTPTGLYNCVQLALHSSGYLVVACRSGNVGSYKINGSGAATTLASTVSASVPAYGTYATATTFGADGRYVISLSPYYNLTTYAFDPTSGRLSPAFIQPTVLTSGLSLTGLVQVPARSYIYLPCIMKP